MPGQLNPLPVPPPVNEMTMLNAIRLAAASGGGGGGGTVTSVSFTGGLISVATPTTTPALTVAGTSGGIPYFDSASSWASSGVLAANALMIGGGAGAAPATTTTGANVLTALGVDIGSAGAIVVNGGVLGTPSSGTLTNCTGLPAAGVVGTAAILGANSFTAAQTITLTALGTTPTAGLSLINTTDAALGAQQVSPGLVLQGEGWRSGNSTNHTVAMRQHVLPVQGSSADPLGRWTLGISIDGGAYSNVGSWGLDVFGASTLDFATSQAMITVAGTGRLNYNYSNSAAWTLVGNSGISVQNDGNTSFFYLVPAATNRMQIGLDAAGVSNQSITAANRITSDGVGANLTISGGNGRGGAGGTLILSTYDTAGAATAGTLRSRMTFDTAGAVSFPVVTAVTTETVVSDTTWPVTINGVAYKVCLKA